MVLPGDKLQLVTLMLCGVTARTRAFACPQAPPPPESHSAWVRVRGLPGGPPVLHVSLGGCGLGTCRGSHHLRPQEHVALLVSRVWPCACSCPEIGALFCLQVPMGLAGGLPRPPPFHSARLSGVAASGGPGVLSRVGLHEGWVVRCSSQENSSAVSSCPFEAQELLGHDVISGEGPGSCPVPSVRRALLRP